MNQTKNDLLEKWREGTLSYEEALELKVILGNEAMGADDAKRTHIISSLKFLEVAILGLGLLRSW